MRSNLDRPIPNSPEQKTRFWSKVDLDGPNGCYLWVGSVSLFEGPKSTARPTFYVRDGVNSKYYAYRIAFAYRHGRWPEYIRQTCGNTLCVNADHLEELTHQERGSKRPLKTQVQETKLVHGTREKIDSSFPYLVHCKRVGCHNFAISRKRYRTLYCSPNCRFVQVSRDCYARKTGHNS